MVTDHGGALEYDLLTATGYTLDDVGGRLPLRALANFVRHLPVTSATKRELDGLTAEQDDWVQGRVLSELMAILIDEIRGLEWMYESAHSKSRIRRPKRIPTPWSTDEELGVRRYGKDPIPVKDFDAWWDEQERIRQAAMDGGEVPNGD